MARPEHWLRFAKDGLLLAKMSISADYLIIVGALYHSQQCAEKALKAYLSFKEKVPPRTHDLANLIYLCAVFDQEFLIFLEDADILTPFSVASRYPDNVYSFPDLGLAQSAIIRAEKILIVVENKIENEI